MSDEVNPVVALAAEHTSTSSALPDFEHYDVAVELAADALAREVLD